MLLEQLQAEDYDTIYVVILSTTSELKQVHIDEYVLMSQVKERIWAHSERRSGKFPCAFPPISSFAPSFHHATKNGNQ
jgi:hypothetical protein